MIDKKQLRQEQKTVLVGVITSEQSEQQLNEYLDELAFLSETAGVIAVKRFTQKLQHPDSRTFVGKGKLEEIKNYVQGRNIRIVIFDDELTGAQINNIEKEIEVNDDPIQTENEENQPLHTLQDKSSTSTLLQY